MSKVVVANWKMNPQTYAEAEQLMFSLIGTAKGQNTKVIICPPFVWLTDLSHKYKNEISFGAQDIFWEDSGAYTGEISPKMLFSSGVEYVIVGHSERRALGETDETANKKMKAALSGGLIPILAVGENDKSDNREEILFSQLKTGLDGVDSSKIIIAYEPVWAIGPGEAETPEHAVEAVGMIKKIVGDIPVLYGGSVDSKNVSDFVSRPEIGGVLVGGASIDKEEIKKIIEITLNA